MLDTYFHRAPTRDKKDRPWRWMLDGGLYSVHSINTKDSLATTRTLDPHMADEKNADRSSIEIKTLLRKLHPDRGNHRDRVRALTKFRNYVLGGGSSKKPEFYDDDIPLLLLGSAAPPQYIDPDDETLVGLYGLLQACGTPASDDSHGLKRSARPAMELTKQLLFDWKDDTASKEPTGPKNVIANSFLSLPVKYYAHMQLHVHIRGEDTRAAAQEEACQTLVLLLEHHLTEDGEKPAPCMVDDVLHNPKAQQVFERTYSIYLFSS